jgi:dTDP-glucose 4,6-dehydratase
MSNILISGGAGFLGHHLVEHILKKTEHTITIIDRLTYASSGFNRLKDIGAYNNPRVEIFTHDFTLPIREALLEEIEPPDYICHLGAETHVDNSIKNPQPFIMSNVIGTMQMLELAKACKPKKFLYFSTDEVFGDAPDGVSYKEWDRYNSRNPYAASKAAGEELTLAYANTYNIPVIITHCHNIFGERQHKEKYIPIVINAVRSDSVLNIHCTNNIPASRSWIHARNVSDAILFLLTNTPERVRDKFNIPGYEIGNLDLALFIADKMGKVLLYKKTDYYSGRPGHDPRYRLDANKISEMGWIAPVDVYASLEKSINWSLKHPQWLDWK